MSGVNTHKLLKILVPGGFVLGAGMELFMVKVPIGGKTFYDVAKEKKEERLREALLLEEEFIAAREERRMRLKQKYGDKIVQDPV
mmetsp:Transcript_18550/g.22704  ORF Transcript_18550/g.22704 Transcript_18550/m.22704 type:complete len:85 (+) Transcript_18550:1836-2090(+)|eukprot:CAMPEP_0204876258 /NCGR_PEP_ID=MMETSP1348-20121228/47535_1 /ASSEMBLY_ACC=CAM_ASM_000700 /TAXON_ID=215587 /ORGANISM="Aplanochytrium stocchinoi, Strain GSBS06" /LENGTH=84 /DNA_ID=CAMNT_0052032991 /DNA_START=391 /DNA_END=645 /DNA_ORIENTATION=-